jgi:hypothetical protein
MAPQPPDPSDGLTGRQVLGKFIVDFIETFAGIAGALVVASFVVPDSLTAAINEGWAFVALLAGPFITSIISAARHAGLWGYIRRWLLAGAEATVP